MQELRRIRNYPPQWPVKGMSRMQSDQLPAVPEVLQHNNANNRRRMLQEVPSSSGPGLCGTGAGTSIKELLAKHGIKSNPILKEDFQDTVEWYCGIGR